MGSWATLRGWRYADGGKRDLRIDYLRGIAISVMVVNHLTSRSYINQVTQGCIYASAAEGFIFLSGLVLGTVSRMPLEQWAHAKR